MPYEWGNLEAGSRVRPYKIYHAFIEAGYEVLLLSGRVSDRWKIFRRLVRSRSIKTYDFCYSEPPTWPVHPLVDYAMYLYLRRHRIPIGVYYRDAYWRFTGYSQRRWLEKLLFLARYRQDLFMFDRLAAAMFFPSATFSDLFDLRCKKVVLPPGGEVKETPSGSQSQGRPPTGIYVGGISKRYGLGILLNAFGQANSKVRVNLIMVCHRDAFEEQASEIAPFLGQDWLSVHHVSGPALDEIYRDADFGIVPLEVDDYNTLAMPVKLFEYLSFQLPVIATNCWETARFVTENKIGLVCEATPASLGDAVLSLISDRGCYDEFRANSRRALIERNLWVHRVKTIADTLSRQKPEA